MASNYAPTTKANHPKSMHNVLARGLDDGQPLMLTPEEVGARLRLSPNAVRELIDCGELHALRIGRGRRVKRVLLSEVERYVAEMVRQQYGQ